jgi:ATP-dependent helicase/nuclease subunit B
MARISPDGSRLFTVPFGVPFLETLARELLAGSLPPGAANAADTPFALADTTVLVPTRRASRALQETFLRLAPNGGLLLPQIRPISETDEDLGLLTAATAAYEPQTAAPIPPAIDGLERQLLLADLICHWGRELGDSAPSGITEPAQALALARDLASLMDLVETEGVSLARLDDLVPDELSRHWQITTSFLKIIVTAWPGEIEKRGLLSPTNRRNRLLRAETDRIAADAGSRSPQPIVVAGVTGSIPATAELMRAVAEHPAGAIVLPGLDLDLDDDSFGHVPAHHEHPQHGLAGLLRSIGASRDDVIVLGRDAQNETAAHRARILSEAMRPAATTSRWPELKQTLPAADAEAALDGLSLVSAPTPLDEAEVVSLILREALETPGQTAALISPDRLLARRVAVRMRAWGIEVDDSAGRPFRKTPPGAFLDLVLTVFETDFAPQAVVELLKHPLCRLGLGPGDIRRRARNLEVAAFRTVYLGRGLDGIRTSLMRAEEGADGYRASRPVRAMKPEAWREVDDLVARLDAAFAPLTALQAITEPMPLSRLVAALIETAETLAAVVTPDDDESDAASETANRSHPLWTGEAGELASTLLARLLDETLAGPAVTPKAFPDFYRTLIVSEAVRPMTPVHPRLTIWGPYEARLQSVDVVVLGGLNDRTWPEIPDAGPWLNRPMRRTLGLPQPEEAIGRAAHDFVQHCATPRVVFTRSEKVDGVPTVPSRWLLRLMAVLRSVGAEKALAPDRPWLSWSKVRTASETHVPTEQPAPTPALALRPKRLSVTDIERWIANPYALYASKILNLAKLQAIGQEPDAQLKGMIVHQALARFAKAHPETLPDDSAGALEHLSAAIFAEYAANPSVVAFWMPRFARFAAWFGDTEPDRRADLIKTHAEVDGQMTVFGEMAKLDLRGRADRIDETRQGLVIYDYKSGAASGVNDMAGRAAKLLQPQLPLEAAMAEESAFPGLSGEVAGLVYISTSGATPPGATVRIKTEASAAGKQALDNLKALIDQYADPATPYRALRRGQFSAAYRYDDYAQLARIGEWRAGEDDAGDAA